MTDYLLSTFLTQVDELTFEGSSDKEMSDAARYRQIRAAIQQYSHDLPDIYVEDESGDGGKYYAITDLANWVEGFSRILQIEYPAASVTADETPTYLEPEDYDDNYQIDVSSTGQVRYIRFINVTPASAEDFRVTYTVPYFWTVSTTTTDVSQTGHGFLKDDFVYLNSAGTWVEATNENLATHQVTAVGSVDAFTAGILQTTTPDEDFTALCWKAACLLCRAIATKYSRIGDSLVGADAGAHVTKAQEFSSRADKFCKMYREHLGLDVDPGQRENPAGTFVDWDTAPGWRSGRRYLFHRSR